MRLRNILHSKWLQLGVLLFFFFVFFADYHPLLSEMDTSFLGIPRADLYDEMWLDQAVLKALSEGKIFTTNARNFPVVTNFLTGFISYGHTYLLAPITYFLPWPLWWNVSIVLSIVLSGFTLFWAIERLTSQTFIAFCSGIMLIVSDITQYQVHGGYLPQLWTAPFILALVYLYETVNLEKQPKKKNSKAWFWLAFWTLVSTAIYSLNGLFLAVAGIIAILSRLPHLTKRTIKHLCGSVLLTVVVMLPFSWQTISLQPILQDAMDGEIIAASRRIVIKRCQETSLHLLGRSEFPKDCLTTDPDDPILQVYLENSQYIPALLGLIFLLAVVAEADKPKGASLFCGITFTYGVLALGPYLNLMQCHVVYAPDTKLKMPFYLLLEAIPFLYRWTMPNRIIISTIIVLAISAGFITKICKKRSGNFAFLLIQLLMVSTLLTASSILSGSFFHKGHVPLYYASSTHHSRFLSTQSKGVVVDLPLGYVNNTYQNFAVHKHKMIQGQTQEYPNLLATSPFLLYMNFWNSPILSDAIKTEYKDNVIPAEEMKVLKGFLAPFRATTCLADPVPYGARYPTIGKDTVSSLKAENFPGLARITPRKIMDDYTKLYRKGLRYIVVHRANCAWVSPYYSSRIYSKFVKVCRIHFGKPIFSSYNATIFLLPRPKKVLNSWIKIIPYYDIPKIKKTTQIVTNKQT